MNIQEPEDIETGQLKQPFAKPASIPPQTATQGSAILKSSPIREENIEKPKIETQSSVSERIEPQTQDKNNITSRQQDDDSRSEMWDNSARGGRQLTDPHTVNQGKKIGRWDIDKEKKSEIDKGNAGIESVPVAAQLRRAEEGKKGSLLVTVVVIMVLVALIAGLIYMLVYHKDLIGL